MKKYDRFNRQEIFAYLLNHSKLTLHEKPTILFFYRIYLSEIQKECIRKMNIVDP